MRLAFTIFITKLTRWILSKFGRGGSLPGKIAMMLCPDALDRLEYPDKIIIVTGTNGKTTTNNMAYQVVQKKYTKVICNTKGDNLMEGITNLLLCHTKGQKVDADAIVLEVDELNVPKVLKRLPISDMIVNNFFRDQLDRAGEMETIVTRMEEALKDYHGCLILNGDDPNASRLGYHRDNTYYFGVDRTTLSVEKTSEASEGKFCFRCNSPLHYDYYQYSHIGRFHCPQCDFGNHERLIVAHNVDLDHLSFEAMGLVFHLPRDTIYFAYNCCAIITLAYLNDIPLKDVQDVFQTFDITNGRMETFHIGRDCLLNLVKNPTGANETLKYIERDPELKDILIILNDNDQDGTDVSWIWDANFDLIMGEDVVNIICSGQRAYDMALRLKYTDYLGNIIIKEDTDEAVRALKSLDHHAYVIATYTALQPIRHVLRRYEE